MSQALELSPIRRRHFKALRARMVMEDIEVEDVAEAIGRDGSYVRRRLQRKSGWTLRDVVTICYLLHIPLDEIERYFVEGEMKKDGSDYN